MDRLVSREERIIPKDMNFKTALTYKNRQKLYEKRLKLTKALLSWPENQGILFFYISKTLQMIRISFMASLLNAVL